MIDDKPLLALVDQPGTGAMSRDVWAALMAMCAAGPEAMVAWVAERPWLLSALLGISLAASRAQQYRDELTYTDLCAIRSGLEFLRHGLLRHGADDPAEVLDLDRWDDVLQILAESPLSEPVVPRPAPSGHWWWRAQTEGRPANVDYDPWDPETW